MSSQAFAQLVSVDDFTTFSNTNSFFLRMALMVCVLQYFRDTVTDAQGAAQSFHTTHVRPTYVYHQNKF